MFLFKSLKKIFILVIVFLSIFTIFSFKIAHAKIENEAEETIKRHIENLFLIKSKCILTQDLDCIKSLYCNNSKCGQWAFEYEERKVKYINNWAEKQGVKFLNITPNIKITRHNLDNNTASFYVLCDTKYEYEYIDDPSIINNFKIGTSHSIKLNKIDDSWIITKEWYNDPFADSLSLENIKVDDIKAYIANQQRRDFSSLDKRRIAALEYAVKYCGVSSIDEYNFKYNKKYKNFNCEGGDCANFASQMLHEGGKFKRNSLWNYEKGSATPAWINADKFTSYMLNSGRASLISKGNYEKVYKSSYKLLPGDFVAYEKKGDIKHISVVTGADSKGYTLVTCHNTDRNNVPWDLGWSNKEMKFWLVRVHF